MRLPRLSLGWTLAIIWAIPVALTLYMGYGVASTSIQCVELGYPRYEVSWRLERYCIRLVGGTDEVMRIR